MHYIHWKTCFLTYWTRGRSRGGFVPRLGVTLLMVVWFKAQEGSTQQCYMLHHMAVSSIL